MTTRVKDGIYKPKVYQAKLEPSFAAQALQIPYWKQAVDDEYNSHMRNNTWQLVQLPTGRVLIGSKWVFRVKYNSDGFCQKYKARSVAQWFNQRPRFDFT